MTSNNSRNLYGVHKPDFQSIMSGLNTILDNYYNTAIKEGYQNDAVTVYIIEQANLIAASKRLKAALEMRKSDQSGPREPKTDNEGDF